MLSDLEPDAEYYITLKAVSPGGISDPFIVTVNTSGKDVFSILECKCLEAALQPWPINVYILYDSNIML